jgi:hypothetical protein
MMQMTTVLKAVSNKFTPNFGVGLYFHSDNTYIGISAPNILETQHFDRYASTGASNMLQKEEYIII